MKNSKMKIVSLFSFLFLSLFLLPQVNAQFTVGVKGGTSVKVKEAGEILDGNQAFKDATFGAHGGLFARFNLLGLMIQPEATISTAKNLDVPILAGLKLGPMRAMVGPMMRFDLDRNKNLHEPEKIGLGESMKVGFQAGAGFDISKLTIDLRYESNLSGLSERSKYQSGPSQLVLSAGIKF